MQGGAVWGSDVYTNRFAFLRGGGGVGGGGGMRRSSRGRFKARRVEGRRRDDAGPTITFQWQLAQTSEESRGGRFPSFRFKNSQTGFVVGPRAGFAGVARRPVDCRDDICVNTKHE